MANQAQHNAGNALDAVCTHCCPGSRSTVHDSLKGLVVESLLNIQLAVAVGGEFFGVAGMFLMIPMASVLYTLLREFAQKRLGQRNIDPDKLNPQPPELRWHFQEKRKKFMEKRKKTRESEVVSEAAEAETNEDIPEE